VLVVPLPDADREHLFKVCPEWKAQRKALLAEVKRETGKWKDRWKIPDLLADERCSRAVLDFLSSTDVVRRVAAEEEDTVSAVSSLVVWEWLEEQGARRRGWVPLSLPSPSFMAATDEE
jgi:hypothetical protein